MSQVKNRSIDLTWSWLARRFADLELLLFGSIVPEMRRADPRQLRPCRARDSLLSIDRQTPIRQSWEYRQTARSKQQH
jgi:hypothetical protein